MVKPWRRAGRPPRAAPRAFRRYTAWMDTVLCLGSALELYHVARIADERPVRSDPFARRDPLRLRYARIGRLRGGAPSCDETALLLRQLDAFAPARLSDGMAPVAGLTAPLHVLVSGSTARWTTGIRMPHRASEALPPRSLVRVEPGLLLSSPEHMVLYAASKLDAVSLTWLASELCAVFSVHPTLRGPLLPARPLTTLERLAAYLESAVEQGAYGAKKALRAAGLAVERAASPREIAVCLAMTLPRAMGGRAIPKPVLNHRIDVDRRVGPIHGWDGFTVDACWPDAKLVVEYDSDAHHLDPRRRARDNDKRAALEEMGYRVIPISTKQYDTLQMADDAFQRVAHHLGVRNRAGEGRYDWQGRRSKLRLQLWRLLDRGVCATLHQRRGPSPAAASAEGAGVSAKQGFVLGEPHPEGPARGAL